MSDFCLLVTSFGLDMKVQRGNLWQWHDEGRWIVITTNIGWKKDGTNPMGTGTAKAAADRFEDLPYWYGQRCMRYKDKTAVSAYKEGRLFLFPTKALDNDKPWMSWKADSSLELIAKSSRQLVKLVDVISNDKSVFVTQVALNLPGCGSGNLTEKQVFPTIDAILDDRFVLLKG